MNYNRAFWEDDEDEYGPGIPSQELGGLPEEDLPDAPGFTKLDMYGAPGEPPAWTPADEQSFSKFINQTGDLATEPGGPLDDAPDFSPDEQARVDELRQDFNHRNGGNFEQEAYADMRQNILNQGTGLRWEDAVFPAIASFLDLGLNKGRGLGQIAMGTYAGMNARDEANARSINDLGNLSIRADQSERQKLREQGMQDYYTHSRELGDRRQALDEQREARLANPQPRPVDELGQKFKQAEIDKLNAETEAIKKGEGKGGLTQDQIIDNTRADNNETYRRGRDAKQDAKDAANIAA